MDYTWIPLDINGSACPADIDLMHLMGMFRIIFFGWELKWSPDPWDRGISLTFLNHETQLPRRVSILTILDKKFFVSISSSNNSQPQTPHPRLPANPVIPVLSCLWYTHVVVYTQSSLMEQTTPDSHVISDDFASVLGIGFVDQDPRQHFQFMAIWIVHKMRAIEK